METTELPSARHFGQLVRAVRIASGLSQSEAAALCGVSTPFLSDLEGGKETVQLGRVLAVCHGLGLRLSAASPISLEAAAGRQRRRKRPTVGRR